MENYSFHIVDGIVLAIVAISALVGILRGFTREVLGIFSWAAAVIVALYTHPHLFPYWSKVISYPLLAHIVTFAVTAIAVLTTSMLMTKRMSDAVGDSALGPVDRSLGVGFGVLRGWLAVCLVYAIIASMGDKKDDLPGWLKDAKVVGWAQASTRAVVDLLPEQMQDEAIQTANLETDAKARVARPAKREELPALQSRRPDSGSSQQGGQGYDRREREDLNQLIGTVAPE